MISARRVLSHRRRAGVAAIWALIVISITTILSGVVLKQFVLVRRTQEQYENRVQATWFARSGVNLAANQLLLEPDQYTGEKYEPKPGVVVQITVKPHDTDKTVYMVLSEARYQPPMGRLIAITAKAKIHRQVLTAGNRIEVEWE